MISSEKKALAFMHFLKKKILSDFKMLSVYQNSAQSHHAITNLQKSKQKYIKKYEDLANFYTNLEISLICALRKPLILLHINGNFQLKFPHMKS